MIYALLAALWLGYAITKAVVPAPLLWATALFAIASACYSAFLFGQAKGRDLWHSPLLFWHLLVQSISAGTAVLSLLGTVVGVTLPAFYWMGNILVVSLLVGLAMMLGELLPRHGGEEVKRAGDLLIRGALRKQFWIFVVGFGVIVPVVLILWPGGTLLFNMTAAVLVLMGLWMYENLWIKAGQSVPLS